MTFDPTFSISDVVTALMALASVAAVLTTLYVYRKESEPRVVACLRSEREKGAVSLVVRNDGNGVARNVRLAGFDWCIVEPKFRPLIEGSFVSTGVPMLLPGDERSTIVCTTRYAGENLVGSSAVQHVDYEGRGLGGKWVHCWGDYVLDYGSFANTLSVDSDARLSRVAAQDGAKEAKRQADSLAAIARCADELGELARRANDTLDALDERLAGGESGGER